MATTRASFAGRIGAAAARPALAIAVLIAVGSLCSPARAQHCGWYVAQFDDGAFEAALGLSSGPDATPPASESPAPPPPCEGPGCSRAPAAPSPSPAPPAPPTTEHWAIAAHPDHLDPAPPPGWPRSEGPLRISPPIAGVFHPPRPR